MRACARVFVYISVVVEGCNGRYLADDGGVLQRLDGDRDRIVPLLHTPPEGVRVCVCVWGGVYVLMCRVVVEVMLGSWYLVVVVVGCGGGGGGGGVGARAWVGYPSPLARSWGAMPNLASILNTLSST